MKHPNPQPNAVQAVLRLRSLETYTGISRSRIYEFLNKQHRRFDPTFPRPITLGTSSRSVGWIKVEVDQWLERQASKRLEAQCAI